MSAAQTAASAAPKRKPRLAAIEYIRGISMIGVIAIHIGSQYIVNTSANIHLVALMEIVSRFSVPIFFFISAFGLFYNLDMSAKFDYGFFLKKRFKAVLIPYLVWSVFYILHDGIFYHTGFPDTMRLGGLLLFGAAKYQLYFLVILLWFYLLMPLWIYWVKRIGPKGFAGLMILQIAFDYWSSYSVGFNTYVYGLPDGSLLKPFLMYRLNYWVMHYLFIFLLGGWLALHMEQFYAFMREKRRFITLVFWASLGSLLWYYYHLLFKEGYTALEAINTAHQLSPEGIFYTLGASLFFFTIFTYQKYPQALNPLLHILGKHSYFAYLVHPLFIGYIAMYLEHHGIILTAPLTIAMFLVVLTLSILAAILCRKLGQLIPIINILTIGSFPKKKKA
ncbi:MAG: acyltransferase [Selenomonas sp.]|nr:acyltransferase [Selenomonas sp.]